MILLRLLIRGNGVFKAVQVRQAFFGFQAILLLLLFIRLLFSKLAAHMGWQHSSPSMVISGAIQMSDDFPGLEKTWELKDRSSQSFPADHASVLLIWGMFMSVFAKRIGQFVVIWGLELLFMMPRLAAGAQRLVVIAAAAKLEQVPPLFLAGLAVRAHAQRAGLAQRRRIFALGDAGFGFAVQRLRFGCSATYDG
ncbi:hypothetical protein SAMN05216202_4349 [Pseudomonas mucidolens]|uniref:PAP2 superfamily protein n=1 Tax=Pseudomonas mucidolens TaxID=46679 RepID=A0A1H2NQ55_9PSED|nr:hypothetical protein SAMN05216202_4349 [Pseudomonas mucidolens]SQH31346.1 membrane protein [Pseudomonas mucidolens]